MKFKKIVAACVITAMLSGCVHPGQNRYGEADVGMNAVVEFGTVVSVREVDITGKNTGAGAAVGMGAGLAAGSQIGNGNGSLGAAIAGAFIGAAAGAMAEQAMQDRKGMEYIVTLHGGETVSIVQNVANDASPIRIGQRVMVQTSGTYRRVLPADAMPEEIDQPKKIKVRKAKHSTPVKKPVETNESLPSQQ